MDLAILGVGTAVPGTALDVAQGLRLAQALCRPPAEQMPWLAGLYRSLGVRTRHLVVGDEVLDDAFHGTRRSGLDLLPTDGATDHRGPTTAARMELYARHAGPLAVAAAR